VIPARFIQTEMRNYKKFEKTLEKQKSQRFCIARLEIGRNSKAQHTQSKGRGSATPAETMSGSLNSNSFCSAAEANSARFTVAVPTPGTLFFGPWFAP
jgi:hypothetical protein